MHCSYEDLLFIACLREAFEEFTTLWLDDFNQKSLPADSVQVVCALTTAGRYVPSQVPKQHLARKWKAKVVDILHQVERSKKSTIFGEGLQASVWRFLPDDILDMTARLSKLRMDDALWLVTWFRHSKEMSR